MYNWLPFPFLRITLAYVIGIIAAIHGSSNLSFNIIGWVVVTVCVALIVVYLIGRRYFYSLNLLIGPLCIFILFLLGFARTYVTTPSNNPNHLTHNYEKVEAYIVTTLGSSTERNKTHRVLAKMERVKDSNGWHSSRTKLYLYFQKDSLFSEIKYGDKLMIAGSPDLLSSPKNPYEFDYKQYIGHQGIYYSDYVPFVDWQLIGNNPPSLLLKYSNELRGYFKRIIRSSIDSHREQAIALALILGIKDEIDADINKAYASAGAMHVLAVSGLHVGVVFWVIALLFGKLKKNPKWKWVYLVVVLIVLWGYAFVTGLSSSVLRAVTMFSLVAFGSVSNRQTNIYNTLAASAFLLLCYNPYMIMSVGFQLSFVAVFGIVYMQPKIYSWFSVDNVVLEKGWMITSVSIAAQVATAPLVVLYFHQLPTYFFISNLVVIPGAFVILCSGILLLATYELSYVGEWIGNLLEFFIYLVNEVVFFIRLIPYNTMDNIYITTFQSWCIIVLISGAMALFYFRKFAIAVFLLLPVLSFSGQNWMRNVSNVNQKKIVFYSINNELAIDFIEGNSALFMASERLRSDSEKLKFHIAPNRLAWGVPLDYKLVNKEDLLLPIARKNGVEIIVWNGVSIAIIDGEYPGGHDKLKVDYLYVNRPTYKTMKQASETFIFEKALINGQSYLVDNKSFESFRDKIYSLPTQGALVVDVQ